jgi:hypothetical protein
MAVSPPIPATRRGFNTLRCRPHPPDFIEDLPEIWLRNKAHGSIRVQEGQRREASELLVL